MADTKTILEPLTDQVNATILNSEVMLTIMCSFLGVAAIGCIACHFLPKGFLPKSRGRSRH